MEEKPGQRGKTERLYMACCKAKRKEQITYRENA